MSERKEIKTSPSVLVTGVSGLAGGGDCSVSYECWDAGCRDIS